MLIAPKRPTHYKLMFVMRQTPVDLGVDSAIYSAYKEIPSLSIRFFFTISL